MAAAANAPKGKRRDYNVLRERSLADLVADVLPEDVEVSDEILDALEDTTAYRKVAVVNARHAEHAQNLGAKQIRVEEPEQAQVVVIPTRMWAEESFNLSPDTAVEPA